ncbi:hypothetical protein F4819DRAFT_484759 [Hypoxylon fuscum]|nr:hypothetical protein F4819DRAFT_484759 [Hypoxylon fuscum]
MELDTLTNQRRIYLTRLQRETPVKHLWIPFFALLRNLSATNKISYLSGPWNASTVSHGYAVTETPQKLRLIGIRADNGDNLDLPRSKQRLCFVKGPGSPRPPHRARLPMAHSLIVISHYVAFYVVIIVILRLLRARVHWLVGPNTAYLNILTAPHVAEDTDEAGASQRPFAIVMKICIASLIGAEWNQEHAELHNNGTCECNVAFTEPICAAACQLGPSTKTVDRD